MSDLLKELFEAAVKKWHTRTGLLLAAIVVAFGLLVLFSQIDFLSIPTWQYLVIVIAISCLAGLWWRTHIPRVPRGKIGFGVAIAFEKPGQASLRADLIGTMRDIIRGSDLQTQFHFIDVPPAISARINDQDSAVDFTQRARLSFLIFGRARQRRMPDGSESHLIDLQGVVRHAAIQQALSKQLGEDFRAVLPSRLLFSTNGSFIACEFAAKHLDAVGRYVLGSAAVLSNEYVLAEKLLVESEKRLKAYIDASHPTQLTVVLNRVQTRICDLYLTWLNQLVIRYTQRRVREPLLKAEEILRKLRLYDPDNYLARTSAAMCAFVLRRDVDSARAEIRACEKVPDATWMYSAAFLHAYDGDLENAYRCYMRALKTGLTDETVPLQAEEFIQIIINEEPARIWLYYCLGIINHRAKQDLEAAYRDFTTFVSKAGDSRFMKHVQISRRWMGEIEVQRRL